MKKQKYDITLEELIKGLREIEQYNETGLYEVLGHDLYYFPVYMPDEFTVNETKSEEIIGYFIIYLKDGTALLPFIENNMNKSREQLLVSAFRYSDEDDYEMLLESREFLLRSVSAIEKTIKEKKLAILLKKNIKEEHLLGEKRA